VLISVREHLKMRDNLLTLTWKAQHPIKYKLMKAGAWVLAILLLPLILTYFTYIIWRNNNEQSKNDL